MVVPAVHNETKIVIVIYLHRPTSLLYLLPSDKVCMVITYIKSKDQPGKIDNPARGELNKEKLYFPVRVCA